MGFHFNYFSLTLLIGGVFTLLVALLIFQRSLGAGRWFAYIMLGISIWALSYGIELCCQSLDQMLICVYFEYLGIALLPAFWIVFIIRFVGNDKWLTPLNSILIFSVPLFTIFFVVTNQWHHLYYQDLRVDESGPFPLLAITPGIWYKLHTLYFYSMLAWGLFLLIYKFKRADAVFKQQNYIIILGALIPWIVNLLYLLNIRPFKHIDLTPYAFIAAALVIGFGLLRFGLFDIVPIAREKIIEAIRDGIIVLDAQDRIVDMNHAMREILAIGNAKVIGHPVKEVLPVEAGLKAMIENKENSKAELSLEAGGIDRCFEVTTTLLFEKNTAFSGIILIFSDITKRRLADEKLKEQADDLASLNKLKDKLFSIIAHDLRSPLINLVDILNLINKGLISQHEFTTLLPVLLNHTQYTTGLLENLLLWSKSQLEGEKLHPGNFDLKEVVQSNVQLFATNALEKGVQIDNNIDDHTMVFADKTMIESVIRNLISNALKFCNQDDSIVISAEADTTNVTICISDTGVGIREQDLDKLFGMENFTTRGSKNEEGTGLGLLLCKDFIEKNNGTIWVESELTKGSRFYFTIPVAAPLPAKD